MSIRKILIANRGEIAVRVIRTARALGYRTVATFSDADRQAMHVRLADEAVHLGGSAASLSYLNIPALVDAANRTGADAVHPGYGFLSENTAFARACDEAGLVFVGPQADAIDVMGDKARAKEAVMRAGVPTVPGYFGSVQTDAALSQEAEKLGYPLLVKAVSGGGGRGMRLVRIADQLPEALSSARREAAKAFGDERMMLERFVENARHIEIQVFGDNHGDVVHLGDRDCTTQRRRQKVIEEAPSPTVDAPLREHMCNAAVAAAKAIGYRGAGTVEFVVTPEGDHYFLEMNTRLQVEHPVTEMVTGVDLVEWQLRVAAGEKLPLRQAEIAIKGHAIEARLYAEDPYSGFAPQTGRVLWFQPEQVADRPGVRVDSGVAQGDVISPHYDSMIAKFIAHGRDRNDAIRRLSGALTDAPLVGPRTNQHFLSAVLESDTFGAAAMTTTTLDNWAAEDAPIATAAVVDDHCWALAACWFAMTDTGWFRSTSPPTLQLQIEHDGMARALSLRPHDADGAEGWIVETAGAASSVTVALLSRGDGSLQYFCEGVRRKAFAFEHEGTLYLGTANGIVRFCERSAYPQSSHRDDPRRIVSAVAGTIVRLEVAPGDTVELGDTVAVVEAMKMEMRLTAETSGKVVAVHAAVGQQVEADALLVELELEPESDDNG